MLEFMGVTLGIFAGLGAMGIAAGWLLARHRERAFLKVASKDIPRS